MRKILIISCFLLAQVGYGQAITLTITEIHYNSDSTRNSGDWFELHNYGSNSIDLSLFRIRDSSATGLYLIQPGLSIPAGGYLVFCTDTQQFDAIYNITNRIGNLGYGFNNKTDGIRIFDNTNALVLQLFYQDSLPWPIGADGFGRTLEIINTSLNPSDPLSWRTGCVLGSPGGPFVPCVNETIVVSEINYKSSPTEDAGDWFEIRNIGSTTVDIGNYRVRDDKDVNYYVIPAGTVLAPQGSVVVIDNPVKFNQQFPLLPNKVGPFFFNLAGDGDCIRLYNSADKVIFSIFYDDDPPWSDQPDGNGYTLEADTMFNFSRDVNDASSWFVGCPEGSPGKKYNPDCLGGIYDPGVEWSIYPNPSSDFVRILLSAEIQDWKVKIYNALGQQIMNLTNQTYIPVSNLSNGTYILEIESYSFHSRQKIMVSHE